MVSVHFIGSNLKKYLYIASSSLYFLKMQAIPKHS